MKLEFESFDELEAFIRYTGRYVSADASATSGVRDALVRVCRELADPNGKIRAIKVTREILKCPLKEAKDIVCGEA